MSWFTENNNNNSIDIHQVKSGAIIVFLTLFLIALIVYFILKSYKGDIMQTMRSENFLRSFRRSNNNVVNNA